MLILALITLGVAIGSLTVNWRWLKEAEKTYEDSLKTLEAAEAQYKKIVELVDGRDA